MFVKNRGLMNSFDVSSTLFIVYVFDIFMKVWTESYLA